MAIDLRKLVLDIRNEDEDLVVLSLRTLKRLHPSTLANNPAVARTLASELERLVETASDDVRFFAEECLDFVRENAAQALAAAPAPAVEDAGATGPVPRAQGPAAGVTRDQALAALAKGLVDPARAALALAMVRQGLRPDDMPVVRKYLRHKEAAVRSEAVATVVALGDERVLLEALLPLLNDRDGNVRALVLKSIRGIEHTRLMTVIESMLRSQLINVKVAAVYILAHLQGDEVIRLLGLAARDTNEEVRSRVVDALQGRRGKEVLVVLKGLVNDLDIDVAEKALQIYEKLKFEEGILNSSAELGDAIMQKLKEISMEPDEEPKAPSGVIPVAVPTSSDERITVGTSTTPEMTDYVVPKKQTPSRRRTEEAEAPVRRLDECPDKVQSAVEGLYDDLDALLEEMGRTIWRLEKANRIVEKRFAKLNYDIQRYEDMLEKRSDSAKAVGFWARLSPGNRRLQEQQQLNLEFSLSELYRRMGELAVELAHGEELEFPELVDQYRKVDELLQQVRVLKTGA